MKALTALAILFGGTVCAAEMPYLTPNEELATFHLPPGYRLELVVSDPEIKEPVAIAFDGNGRMFVAEMRAFMQDLEGTDERAKNGRVSMHWSSKGDGVFDRHSVFVDGLILPRMILPLDGGMLIAETDTDDLYLYTDTNADGVADKKKLWYSGGPRGGNLEHQPSGLVWCMDNWIYSSYNAHRLRWNGAGQAPLKEPTAPNGGQWGLSQDDFGKPWFIGGAERGPLNFQQPILYGAFNIDSQTDPDFSAVWPLVGLADVQGGTLRFRPEDKTLNHFSSPCGSDIVRGDRMPADLHGDLLMCEPVGRLVRRAKVTVRDGMTLLRNPYEKSEFIRSTDPNFRPVNLATAPDGCVYIVDMYRGVVQEAVAIRRGSYLRGVVESLGLEKNIGRGRIWRLVHEAAEPGPQPRLLDAAAPELAAQLAHPNGWWRDTAQKLLVLKQDKSVAPALTEMARHHSDRFARLHAMWTLEGLGALDAALVHDLLKDPQPQVRTAAIRVSETLSKSGDVSLKPQVLSMIDDPEPGVAVQVLMTAKLLNWPEAAAALQRQSTSHAALGVREIAQQLLTPVSPFLTDDSLTQTQKNSMSSGEVAYRALCFACHGLSGTGAPFESNEKGTTLAPPLAGSPLVQGPPEHAVLVLLHGLTGPNNGRKYPTEMVPMGANSDSWIANVSNYIRNSFGNRAPFIIAADVTRLRAATSDRKTPPTVEDIQQLGSDMPPAGFTPLFDGLTWANWLHDTHLDGVWEIVDGIIRLRTDEPPRVAGKDYNLSTTKKYKDFALMLDWRLTGKPVVKPHQWPTDDGQFHTDATGKVIMKDNLTWGDSGVFLRGVRAAQINNQWPTDDGQFHTDATGKVIMKDNLTWGDSGVFLRGVRAAQINIWCQPCGSGEVGTKFKDTQASKEERMKTMPNVRADKGPGEWNRFIITLRGDRVDVSLNGKSVIQGARVKEIPTEGPITLQNHKDAVEFRHFFIKEL